MGFALDFIAKLAGMLLDAAPVLILLLILMVGLAIRIGRGEGWSLSDSIYFGFITGTTVGYGDLRPRHPAGKVMAVVIAYVGLIQIGIIVALAVHAAAEAYRARDGLALSALSSPAEAPREHRPSLPDPRGPLAGSVFTIGAGWCARRDSNPRPLAPEASALSG